MKEIITYQCEICGTQYAEKNRAKECEKAHAKPLTVTPVRYNALLNDGTYPPIVNVQFSDGTTLRYRR